MRLSGNVNNLRGSDVTRLIDAVKTMPQVSVAKADGFSNGVLAMRVSFKGTVFEFTDSIVIACAENGLNIELSQVSDNSLVMAMNSQKWCLVPGLSPFLTTQYNNVSNEYENSYYQQ